MVSPFYSLFVHQTIRSTYPIRRYGGDGGYGADDA